MERLKVSQKGRLVVFSQDGEALAEHDIEDTTITIVNEKERESLKLRRLQQKIHKMHGTPYKHQFWIQPQKARASTIQEHLNQ